MLKCSYSRKKYFLKLKQHGLPDALSKEFMFKCLSVMSYKQFYVSTVELIMLSRQQILTYDFHNMRVTWLFYHFFKLQARILHGLENIYQLLIFGNCHSSDATSFSVKRASYFRRFPKVSEIRRFHLMIP